MEELHRYSKNAAQMHYHGKDVLFRMELHTRDIPYNELKKNFSAPKNDCRPVSLWNPDENNPDAPAAQLAAYKRCGYGGIAPALTSETAPDELLDKARRASMNVIFLDEPSFTDGLPDSALAQQLCRKTLDCISGGRCKFRMVKDAVTLSLIAVEDDSRRVVDLRDYTEQDEKGALLCVWDVPEGNWQVQQYYCAVPEEERSLNYLSYDACMDYFTLRCESLTGPLSDYIGSTLSMLFFRELQYCTRNRRMWDAHFNEIFKEKYGYDPAPYYPALFEDLGEDSDHFRAHFMCCRAQMLCDGFFKAAADFTHAHGLHCASSAAEPKSAGAPWIFGDGMLIHKNASASGTDLANRYLYGLNGLKIAASAAYNFDEELVCSTIFGRYATLNESILYREAMNAFARGVNLLLPCAPQTIRDDTRDLLREFNDYAARCQSLLRGGRHVCDIALLYPIYSLSAQTTLYDAPEKGFAYSRSPVNADYMNVINSLLNYCGQDVTVLHPEVFNTRCSAVNGTLHLNNPVNSEQFKVLILPSCSMISIYSLRLLKKFFESGGKILATGELPFRAYEFDPDEANGSRFDEEAARILEEVFGVKKGQIDAFRISYEKSSAAGGRACYLLPCQATADGTDIVDSPVIRQALKSFDLNYDVLIDDMPRISQSGILSASLPELNGFAPEKTVGGVFNYTHRKYSGCDLYFFSNSTNTPYRSAVNLRGHHAICEEWDPHSGKTRRLTPVYYSIDGEDYTTVTLSLDAVQSVFIVGRPAPSTPILQN